MHHHPFISVALTVALVLAAPLLRAAAPEHPNIVILFADDLGYGDLTSYGCPDIKTPVIDGIGQRGVRFTQFYSNAPMCTPSRAALLTGRYQQRVGGLECAIGIGNVGLYDEAVWLLKRGDLGLPVAETTIAEMLRRAGYDTAIIGKWHLGYDRKFWPDRHGFQESFVALGGELDYYQHTEKNGSETLVHNGEPTRVTGYLTDVFVDRAITWISGRRGPYFLYLPFTAPHGPLRAPDYGPEARNAGDTHRDTYRKMVEHMDTRIGDLLATIDRSPTANDTIVVFLSDNGAIGVGRNLPLRGGKSYLWEGGIRMPCVMSWPREIPAGTTTDQVTLNMDLTATLLAAAEVSPPAGRKLDGINLIDEISGRRDPVSRTVFWRFKRGEARRKAVRDGNIKLVIDDGKEELFDLSRDIEEKKNLLAEMPEKAAEMRARIKAWEKEVAAPRLLDFRPDSPALR